MTDEGPVSVYQGIAFNVHAEPIWEVRVHKGADIDMSGAPIVSGGLMVTLGADELPMTAGEIFVFGPVGLWSTYDDNGRPEELWMVRNHPTDSTRLTIFRKMRPEFVSFNGLGQIAVDGTEQGTNGTTCDARWFVNQAQEDFR